MVHPTFRVIHLLSKSQQAHSAEQSGSLGSMVCKMPYAPEKGWAHLGRAAALRGQWETGTVGPVHTTRCMPWAWLRIWHLYPSLCGGGAGVSGQSSGQSTLTHFTVSGDTMPPPYRERTRESGRDKGARLPVFRRESGRYGPSFLPTSNPPLRGGHAGTVSCMVRMARTDKSPVQDILLGTSLLHLYRAAYTHRLHDCPVARYVPTHRWTAYLP